MSTKRQSTGARRRTVAGFTAIELLVVIAIAAVLAMIATPSLRSALSAQRLRSAGTDFVSSLLLARAEAIKRNAQVVVNPLGGTWPHGWTVTTVVTGEQIDKRNPLGSDVTVALAPPSITYESNGRVTAAAKVKVEFRDSNAQSSVAPRCVAVDTSGVPKLSRGACP